MGNIIKILEKKPNNTLLMEDNYLRTRDIVADEKGERYFVLECEEKIFEIIVDNNNYDTPSVCPDLPRVHIPITTKKVMRSIIKLDKPLKSGDTLEQKYSAFVEESDRPNPNYIFPEEYKEMMNLTMDNHTENIFMTDKEVLTKAIDKAVKNGYKPSDVGFDVFNEVYLLKLRGSRTVFSGEFNPEKCYNVIFSHDFARAFWGKENASDSVNECWVCEYDGVTTLIEMKVWQMHLQQMVLLDNPIDYLRKFVDNTENQEKK